MYGLQINMGVCIKNFTVLNKCKQDNVKNANKLGSQAGTLKHSGCDISQRAACLHSPFKQPGCLDSISQSENHSAGKHCLRDLMQLLSNAARN